MTDANTSKDSFVNKAIDAIPGWALGILGIVIGIVMTMQVAGYNNAAIRIIEATAKKYEASAASLEDSAKRFEQIAARVTSLETRVSALEINAARIDQQYHKNPAK
jgi:uncharacterized membrane-anchored protein YhcB (DUF1043 family)